LIVRVHRHVLEAEKLPDEVVTDNIWQERFADINQFEHYLHRNGVHILKFFLNVSAEEQKKRFLDRLEQPEKHWKFSHADIEERQYWDDYTTAYQEAIGNTAAPHAPWYIVPADTKWFARLLVAAAVVKKLRSMSLTYPKMSRKELKALKKARDELLSS
ncbi:MAG: polyphosphate kinase 2 family protein, partial [Gammaproteobacteria bacterium]